MKALMLTEPSVLSVIDAPRPELAENQVLVRVAACGICGSDVHGYDGSTGRRIPPLIMGHEAAGVIAEKGGAVTRFEVGDRVTFDSTVSCGKCDFCRRGQVNLCDNRMVLGVSCGDYRRHGAFAEYVAVPERIVYKLPLSLSFEQAAMIEAVSVAVHAVRRTPVIENGTVFVLGCGMIGLLTIQALRDIGWKSIIAADLDETRLALAKKLGAEITIHSRETDLLEEVLKLTNNRGADAVFEVVGAAATVRAAVMAARKGGAVVLVGNLSPNIELPLQIVVTRELTLLGSCASSGEYGYCIEKMASGAIDVGPLISAVASLEDGPQWFDRLHRGEAGLMKVILKPNIGEPPL